MDTNPGSEATFDSAVAPVGLPALDLGSIGPYRLIRKLGEGGMGQVWLAEQSAPVKRQVALKIIKAGQYDVSALLRFNLERQTLAIMDHPAIAKVFDAGSTPTGQPYFVMEYVPGFPITNYCDQKRLPARERLALLIKVLGGGKQGHQKAITHRDLKPSNILVVEVDGKPVPRIIDFGIAKAISQQSEDETLLTRAGGMVGTPGYMSPEQADPSILDVDTRTDVYSLGVVLYELLAGVLPFDVKQWSTKPFHEVLRQLHEDDPPSPSSRISGDPTSTTIAAKRNADPRRLASMLRGDLDWITLKAMEKDRSRRYGTPSELSADISRYLRNEPVTARPASAAYRAKKYAQRHKFGVAAVSVMLLLLIAFGVMQALQLRQITRERDRANRITDFMTGMFNVSDPSQARGKTITAREILDKASKDIDTELPGDPELQAQMMDVMGKVYENLGLYSRAQSLFARSVEIQTRVLGPTNAATLSSMPSLGGSLREMGRYPEAEKVEKEALATERRFLGAEDPQTLHTTTQLAWTLRREGRYSDAATLGREALEIQHRVLPPDSPQTLSTMNDLASILRLQGGYAEAEKLDRQALEMRRRVLGPDHPQTLDSMTQLASDLYAGGFFSEAEKLDREALELDRRVYGPEHPNTLGEMSNLSNDLESEGRYAEAEKLGRQTLEIQSRVLGSKHPQTVDAIDNLAQIERAEAHYREAEKLDRRTLELRQQILGANHPQTLQSMVALASDWEAEGAHAAAEKLERQAVELQRRILGPENPDTLASQKGLAITLAHERKFTEAEKIARDVQNTDRRVFGSEQPETAASSYTLACIAALTARRDEALSLLRQVVAHGQGQHMETDPDLKSLR